MTNTIKAAANKIREAQLAARVAIMSELKEVETGKRGFASITTAKAQMAGVDKTTIEAVAAKMGLSARIHGKYGTCFSRVAK